MKKRSKILLSAILTIALCLSLIAGSTFALFTSESKVNIAVTSGKVKVTAEITDPYVYSAEALDVAPTATESYYTENSEVVSDTIEDGNYAGTYYYKSQAVTKITTGDNAGDFTGNFANLGTASYDASEQELTLDKVTPGDRVKFTVKVDNLSNVAIKYRVAVSVVNGLELYSALTVKVDGLALAGANKIASWSDPLNPNADIADIPVEIFMPLFRVDGKDNDYQGLSTKIVIAVEAVQGNAAWALLDRINTTLANKEVANTNMSDALSDIAEIADESVIKANKFVWNSETDRFTTESAATTNQVKYFKIYDAMPETQTYSIYASSSWNQPVVDNLTVGFDAGDNTGITAITYDRQTATVAQTVIIRTNGGTLTVNAPLDTVKHYGNADKVDVQAVANASYHENGTVQLIAVKQGHVKLEGEAEANGIYVYNESTTEQKDTSFAEIKITVDNGVDIPKFSRSAVEVQPEGTKVCTIVTDQAKDIYLFNEGIYEQIKTVDAGKNVASDVSATWADNSTKNTANTQTAAQQLANEFNGSYDSDGYIADQEVVVTGDNAGTYTVKFNQETREFETYQGDTKVAEATVVEAVAEVADVASDSGKTADEAEISAVLGGSGTENDPYQIYTLKQYEYLLTINKSQHSSGATITHIGIKDTSKAVAPTYIYFCDDIDFKDFVNPITGNNRLYTYNLIIDGQNHTLSNVPEALFCSGNEGKTFKFWGFEVKNLTIVNFESISSGLFGCYGCYESTGKCIFENITIKDSLVYEGTFLAFPRSSPVEFSNCSVSNTIVYDDNWGMYIGGYVGNGQNVKIDNCSFEGSVLGLTKAGGFVGQGGASGTIVTNSIIKAGTVIQSKAESGGVGAFEASGNFNKNASTGNTFGGSLNCYNKNNANINGLDTNLFTKDNFWVKYGPECVVTDFDFSSTTGLVKYNGNKSYTSMKIEQRINLNQYTNGTFLAGAFPRLIESRVFESTEGSFSVATNALQFIDSAYTGYSFETQNTDNIPSEVGTGTIVNGVLYLNGIGTDGNGFAFSGTENEANKPLTISVIVSMYNGEELAGSVVFTYTIPVNN